MKKSPQSSWLDNLIMFVSPRIGLQRQIAKFSYDALTSNRLHRKRTGLVGTGDTQLTVVALDKAREICRDLCRNNPLIKGLLLMEANGVVGSSTQIQARTEDEEWNRAAEQLWQEQAVNQTIDVTGRFNFHEFLQKAFLSYRRDGDFFVLFTDAGLQGVEGECCGTPTGLGSLQNFTVTNGVAVSNSTKKVIGYYIGTPNTWGYIKPDSYQKYLAENVCHVFSPDRFSQSRGEPALISSIEYIDLLDSYISAELVAAKVAACFSTFVTSKDNAAVPAPYTGGISSEGKDTDTGQRLEKLNPGSINYLEPGELITAVSATRPPSAFDSFVIRLFMLITRPLCLPYALALGDYSQATYMNMRAALMEVHQNWSVQQDFLVRPLARRIWNYYIAKWVASGDLSDRTDKFAAEVIGKKWPYIDPTRDAAADDQNLKLGVTTRAAICARQGHEWKDTLDQRKREEDYIKELGIELGPPQKGVV